MELGREVEGKINQHLQDPEVNRQIPETEESRNRYLEILRAVPKSAERLKVPVMGVVGGCVEDFFVLTNFRVSMSSLNHMHV